MADTNTTETIVDETVDTTAEVTETPVVTEEEPVVKNKIMASFDEEHWYEINTKLNNYGKVTVGFVTLTVEEVLNLITANESPLTITFKISDIERIVSVYSNLEFTSVSVDVQNPTEVLAQFETLSEETIKYNKVINDTDQVKADVDYLAMEMGVEL